MKIESAESDSWNCFRSFHWIQHPLFPFNLNARTCRLQHDDWNTRWIYCWILCRSKIETWQGSQTTSTTKEATRQIYSIENVYSVNCYIWLCIRCNSVKSELQLSHLERWSRAIESTSLANESNQNCRYKWFIEQDHKWAQSNWISRLKWRNKRSRSPRGCTQLRSGLGFHIDE